MEDEFRLRVLGPVGICDGSGWQSPPGPQLRLTLAWLALSPGHVVPVDDLVEGLWEERPPPSARKSLQILVVRLRQALAPVPACTLDRHGDGYLLRARPGQVDVDWFRSLVRSAKHAATHDEAVAILDQALALWRGPALADVSPTARADAIRAGLAEEHLSAAQDRFVHLLAAGRHSEAAAEIPPVLAAHPLAERLAGFLMVAWYRCGRQADALQLFRELRGRLANELGIEPGPELQRLHQLILAGDSALAAAEDSALAAPEDLAGQELSAVSYGLARDADRTEVSPVVRQASSADEVARIVHGNGHRQTAISERRELDDSQGMLQQVTSSYAVLAPVQATEHFRLQHPRQASAAVIPRQLPAPPPHFAGRQPELRSLTASLDERAGTDGPVVLAVSGPPGTGKTALAHRWARQVQERFPDGQLYLNLRGYDASLSPLPPAEAVTIALESLGVAADQISPRPDAREGMYRSLLADRQVLIVLDNARDEAQVRPLLPGSAGCAVLITSRNELGGLVASHSARSLTLGMLSDPESRQLLAGCLGAERAEAEGEAVAELIGLCAGLPLALVIAVSRAAIRPAFPLATLAAELRGTRERLDGLDAGDQEASIRAVFSWSYLLLSQPAARMFRLLGAHPGPDASAAAAACLAEDSAVSARAALSELARANLIQELAPARFTLHDLLRTYAADLSDGHERGAAIRRALDHYLHTTGTAVRLAYPDSPPAPAAIPEPPEQHEPIASPTQAQAWLQAEHHVVQASIAAAADRGFDGHAWQLAAVLQVHLARSGHYADWARAQRTAVASAARLGDRAARALAHRSLGNALIQLGSCQEAAGQLGEALHLYGELGDQSGQAACHCGIARLSGTQGDHRQALHHARQALRLYRAAGDLAGQAAALNGVGWDYAMIGDSQRALSYCKKALELHRQTGDRHGQAQTLDSLGYCCHQTGRHGQAAAFYQQALDAYAEAGDRYYRAHTLIRLGRTRHATGHPDVARDLWQQALAILADLHHPDADPIRAKLKAVAVL